jgi:hypothetical protein
MNELAWHFSTNRRKAYCSKVEFVRVNPEHIEVRKSKLSSLSSNKVLTQKITPKTWYLQGTYFRNTLKFLLSSPKWKHSELKDLLLAYMKFLIQFQKTENPMNGEIYLEEFSLDFTPRNIVIKKNGEWEAFDSEWQFKHPVDLRYLLFRAVLSLQKFSFFAEDEFGSRHTLRSLYDLFCLLLDLRTDEKSILEFIEQEVEFQREVSASQIEVEEFIYFLNQPMGRGRFSPYHPIFTSAVRDNDIVELKNILNSNIWKATKPYRWIRDKF